MAAFQALAALNIMGRHQSKFLSVRPARPPFWRQRRAMADRPRVGVLSLPSRCPPSPKSDSDRPRHIRFKEIVSVPTPHKLRTRSKTDFVPVNSPSLRLTCRYCDSLCSWLSVRAKRISRPQRLFNSLPAEFNHAGFEARTTKSRTNC